MNPSPHLLQPGRVAPRRRKPQLLQRHLPLPPRQLPRLQGGHARQGAPPRHQGRLPDLHLQPPQDLQGRKNSRHRMGAEHGNRRCCGWYCRVGPCKAFPCRWRKSHAPWHPLHIPLSFFSLLVEKCVRLGTCIDVMEVMASQLSIQATNSWTFARHRPTTEYASLVAKPVFYPPSCKGHDATSKRCCFARPRLSPPVVRFFHGSLPGVSFHRNPDDRDFDHASISLVRLCVFSVEVLKG